MARIDDVMKTKFANDKHRFAANVIYTSNWIKNQFYEFIKPFGLSSQQFNILRILRGANDWVSMNDIKNRMVEKSPNATRLCDKLIEKRLIERRRNNSDRRLVFLKISKQGLQLLKEIDEHDDGSHMSFFNNISDEEAKIVSQILDKIRS
ncbi:MarR family transcriptional regulator [Aquimarina sp. 2201CG1-2-11]|uniref:MarR family winged helix-turn-helix transcriptional regulator n=1 Tax=Aquimarina discodermiae TaxID=3231043 RepID=UPI0034628FB1